MNELPPTDNPIEGIASVARLSRDLRTAAQTMSDQEARYLVDAYYISQEDRKRTDNQQRAMGETEEPVLLIEWLADQSRTLENQIKGALDRYTEEHKRGVWLRSVPGIGPVLAAGLIAHIDVTKCPTVGHLWSFAGLDPSIVWGKGQKRPFNAKLKTLCWKVGQSFMKLSTNDKDYYGHIYKERKAREIERNGAGEFSEQATGVLEKKKIGKTTDAYKWYSGSYAKLQIDGSGFKGIPAKEGEPGVPMLPPAHIDARARRWAVKLFLSHLHAVWYEQEFGKAPPEPYALAITGHAHLIPVPTF